MSTNTTAYIISNGNTATAVAACAEIAARNSAENAARDSAARDLAAAIADAERADRAATRAAQAHRRAERRRAAIIKRAYIAEGELRTTRYLLNIARERRANLAEFVYNTIRYYNKMSLRLALLPENATAFWEYAEKTISEKGERLEKKAAELRAEVEKITAGENAAAN